eukprot:Em0020g721a
MEDFDQLYEDELELMREMEDEISDHPRPRRALELSSPLLTPGSRKRPSENTPLPLLNLDSPGSIDKTPHHALVSGSSPSTPLSARPKGSQSTPVSSCERQLSSHSVGPKGSQLSARRLLDNTPCRDKARPVLHDVGNAPGLELPPSSPHPHGYVRSPSPYSLDPTPSPPSLPNVSGMAGEETPRRDRMEERSTFGTMAPSCLKTKVSDWLRKGGVALDRHKGCGGNASEDWDELAAGVEGGEEVGSVSPLERELRDMEEHYHRMEVDLVESPAPPPLGEGGASQGEGTHPDPPVSRPKRPRVVESAEEPVDTTVARVPRASQRGGLGEGGGGRVLTRAPACPHVSVTGTDGTRVYMKMATAAEEEGKNKVRSSSHHLLPVQFTRLRQMVEEEKRRRLIEQSDQLLQSLQGDVGESEPLFESEEPVRAGEEEEEESNRGILWVEKYSPKSYTELLSDDGINRTLLSWLKLWDEVVFGRKSVLREKTEKEKKMEEKKGGGRGDRKVDVKDPSTLTGPEVLDESRCPRVKIALLCGSPGLGKTTLAHVIAQHAGYNVVEMNASDDRSPEMFRNNIEASTQMQAVLTSHSKPNCLIIDEIDGAPTAAINVLIDLIKKKEGGGKKKKRDIVLLRPIICICNDQYAPSLRQLRQHALILYFPATASARLAARLHQHWMALCEKSDERHQVLPEHSSVYPQEPKELTLATVQSISLGQKDAQRSLFSLWKEVFQLSL